MILVQQAGIQTSIQDFGRRGHQCFGIAVGGVMSVYDASLANILVGNPASFPVLELVQSPQQFLVEQDLLVCFCGGGLQPERDGAALPLDQPLFIPKGTVLKFAKPIAGFRLYFAIAGGFKADSFLGSASTYFGLGKGGHQGRILRKGDRLEALQSPGDISRQIAQVVQSMPVEIKTAAPIFAKRIRVLEGLEYVQLSKTSKLALEEKTFTLSNQSNRAGFRLEGELLRLEKPFEMISTAVSFGAVQLLPDGTLIGLMADCQTVGGYPRIAQIIEADLRNCAQLKPHDQIWFDVVTLATAEALYGEQQAELTELENNMKIMFS